MMLILAMLLIAATAYNQTSRRPANSNKTAQRSNQETFTTTRKETSTANQKQRENAIVKTKPTDRGTYHYDPNSPAKKSTTQKRNTSNTQRNLENKTTIVTTPRTQKTTQSREVNPTYNNRRNNTSKDANLAQNYKPGDSRRVNSTHPVAQNHHEYSSPRVYRAQHTVVHHYNYKPAPREYRAKYYAYRRPAEIEIIWTPVMHRHYIRMYPMVKYWYYTNGYHISMVSAYDAEYYRGEVRTVYGRVTEVFYSRATDEYFLYFGLYYPYQDFTVVLPGTIARQYSFKPERYFDQRYLAITGLITTFNGEPEIVVKESFQINFY